MPAIGSWYRTWLAEHSRPCNARSFLEVGFESPRQAVAERDGRLVTEIGLSPANAGLRHAHIAGTRWLQARLNIRLQQVIEALHQLQDCRALAGCDIINIAGGGAGIGGQA